MREMREINKTPNSCTDAINRVSTPNSARAKRPATANSTPNAQFPTSNTYEKLLFSSC